MQVYKDETTGKPVKIVMNKPADMHQHLRQGAMLKLVAPMVAKRFASAIIMPNTIPPITSSKQMAEYYAEVIAAAGPGFRPLMTFYLTDTLDPKEIEPEIGSSVFGIKYYPRGLTTNSDSGVKNPADLWTPGTRPYECLQTLTHGGVFMIHAADGLARADVSVGNRKYKADDELDPYDQEQHFIQETLPSIREAHPKIKISVEHLSTKWGVGYVQRYGGELLGASLTAHHLLLDRRDVFRGGFRPHRSWMPVIQPPEHRESLRYLAGICPPCVWLGSDSAPHPRSKKESACCASGVFMSHAGIELYAEAFEDMNDLDHLEEFASFNGPKFFGLEPSKTTITLVREEWKPEPLFFVGDDELVPFRLGETVRWKLAA